MDADYVEYYESLWIGFVRLVGIIVFRKKKVSDNDDDDRWKVMMVQLSWETPSMAWYARFDQKGHDAVDIHNIVALKSIFF